MRTMSVLCQREGDGKRIAIIIQSIANVSRRIEPRNRRGKGDGEMSGTCGECKPKMRVWYSMGRTHRKRDRKNNINGRNEAGNKRSVTPKLKPGETDKHGPLETKVEKEPNRTGE